MLKNFAFWPIIAVEENPSSKKEAQDEDSW